MHELLFARAAWPNPVVVTGLLLKPYSIGHDLRLIKLLNPLANSNQSSFAELNTAAMICHQTWRECERMPWDLLIRFKLWLWKRRRRKCDFLTELQKFIRYRDDGSLEFPPGGIAPNDRTTPARPPGCPFLLRLYQFIHREWNEADAKEWDTPWDYPLGLAKCRYGAYLEENGCWEVYGELEAKIDASILEMEKKGAEQLK